MQLGNTALSYTWQLENNAVFQMLVEAKADVNVPQQVLIGQTSCLVSGILLGKRTLLSIEGWFDVAGKYHSFISSRGEGKASLGAKAS